MPKRDDRQLEFSYGEAPKLKLIQGLGQKQQEPLASRDAVARVLMEAGADLLLRRISSERAEEIEKQVDEILDLFDRVDQNRLLFPVLQKKLDALEVLMRETREKRRRVTRR
jgi:hypothetical protein